MVGGVGAPSMVSFPGRLVTVCRVVRASIMTVIVVGVAGVGGRAVGKADMLGVTLGLAGRVSAG